MGRPTDYSEELALTICSRLADGESLRQICASDGMPDKATVLRWIPRHPGFRDQYAHAREMQSEHWADEILEIADNGTNDWVMREGKDGAETEVVDHDHIARSRLRVDSRKWLMSKLAPKKYGDKVVQEVTGPEGGPVQIDTIRHIIVDPRHPDSAGVPAAPEPSEV